MLQLLGGLFLWELLAKIFGGESDKQKMHRCTTMYYNLHSQRVGYVMEYVRVRLNMYQSIYNYPLSKSALDAEKKRTTDELNSDPYWQNIANKYHLWRSEYERLYGPYDPKVKP